MAKDAELPQPAWVWRLTSHRPWEIHISCTALQKAKTALRKSTLWYHEYCAFSLEVPNGNEHQVETGARWGRREQNPELSQVCQVKNFQF
jgi:hypothetical protein